MIFLLITSKLQSMEPPLQALKPCMSESRTRPFPKDMPLLLNLPLIHVSNSSVYIIRSKQRIVGSYRRRGNCAQIRTPTQEAVNICYTSAVKSKGGINGFYTTQSTRLTLTLRRLIPSNCYPIALIDQVLRWPVWLRLPIAELLVMLSRRRF